MTTYQVQLLQLVLENINMIVFENGTHQIINVRPKKIVSSRNNSSGQRRNRFNGDLLAIGRLDLLQFLMRGLIVMVVEG